MTVTWGSWLHKQLFLPPLPKKDPEFQRLEAYLNREDLREEGRFSDFEGECPTCLISLKNGAPVLLHRNPAREGEYIHPFHAACVDQWVQTSHKAGRVAGCQLCRFSLASRVIPQTISDRIATVAEKIFRDLRTDLRNIYSSLSIERSFIFLLKQLGAIFVAGKIFGISSPNIGGIVFGLESGLTASLVNFCVMETIFAPLFREWECTDRGKLAFYNMGIAFSAFALFSSTRYSLEWIQKRVVLNGLASGTQQKVIECALTAFSKAVWFSYRLSFGLLFSLNFLYAIHLVCSSKRYIERYAHFLRRFECGLETTLLPKKRKITWGVGRQSVQEVFFLTRGLKRSIFRIKSAQKLLMSRLQERRLLDTPDGKEHLKEVLALFIQECRRGLEEGISEQLRLKQISSQAKKLHTQLEEGSRSEALASNLEAFLHLLNPLKSNFEYYFS